MDSHFDTNTVYLSVFAGAGGEDAKDWARMLLLMYKKYSDRKGLKYSFVNDNTLEVRGKDVYDLLKDESGVVSSESEKSESESERKFLGGKFDSVFER